MTTIHATRPPIVFDDTARTRRTDPLSSHVGADKSQRTIEQVKAAVVALVRQEGELSGAELNDLYSLRAARNGWDDCAWDSPRKRAGELAKEGVLIVTNPDDPRGTPHIYRVKEETE